jgi:L-amino acid N-acyltransferase YncA
MATFSIRSVRDATDIEAIVAIYASYVRGSLATWAYAEELPLVSDYLTKWQSAQIRALPWLVATADSDSDGTVAGTVIGFCYVGDFRGRLGWRFTCEHSVYVLPAWTRKGVGRSLVSRVLDDCRLSRVSTLIAVISTHANGFGSASVALHEGLGFKQAGFLKNVGVKGGLILDCVLLSLELNPIPADALLDKRGDLDINALL